jgi:hypothetical protein
MRGVMSLFLDRAFRAAKLDASLYEEVVADTRAMTQAMIIVFLYGVAAAYGTFGRSGPVGINIAIVTTIIGWYIWTFFIYMAGARLFPESKTTADRKSLLRALGFASGPGWIRILGLVPGLSIASFAVSSIWMIVTATVATKQALNYSSTTRAAIICLVCWIISALVQLILYVILFSAFGVPTKAF